MARNITFKGKPLTLVGRELKQERPAADFKLIKQDLTEVGLSDYKNKIKVLTSFLSIDTPVCDMQVKEFNKQATKFSGDIVILGISKDLPFAQKRFCQANNIANVTTLSDYRYSSFGINYGLLIKELNLLARAVVIVDKADLIRYVQIINEATNPPDYASALKALEDIVKKPQLAIKEMLPHKCTPCEAGAPPLDKKEVEKLFFQLKDWELIEGKKIKKDFKHKDFEEAKYFLDLISVIAQQQRHHPTMCLIYNTLRITLTTHASGGLTENDFIMAKIIDEVA